MLDDQVNYVVASVRFVRERGLQLSPDDGIRFSETCSGTSILPSELVLSNFLISVWVTIKQNIWASQVANPRMHELDTMLPFPLHNQTPSSRLFSIEDTWFPGQQPDKSPNGASLFFFVGAGFVSSATFAFAEIKNKVQCSPEICKYCTSHMTTFWNVQLAISQIHFLELSSLTSLMWLPTAALDNRLGRKKSPQSLSWGCRRRPSPLIQEIPGFCSEKKKGRHQDWNQIHCASRFRTSSE